MSEAAESSNHLPHVPLEEPEQSPSRNDLQLKKLPILQPSSENTKIISGLGDGSVGKALALEDR